MYPIHGACGGLCRFNHSLLPPLFFPHCTPEARTAQQTNFQTPQQPTNNNKNRLFDFDLQNWFGFISLVLVSWLLCNTNPLQANRGNQLVSNLSSGAPLDAAIWASCIEAATKSCKAQLLMGLVCFARVGSMDGWMCFLQVDFCI